MVHSISAAPYYRTPLPLAPKRTNHTKWFWRDQRRAYNEQTALGLVVPVLEDAYAVGGELKPFGPGFRESCLRDELRENGAMLSRSRLRAAIRVSA